MKHLSATLLSVGCVVGIPLHALAQRSVPKNVIFILADDLGWNDLGFMGSRYYETPNLDRLATRGVVFTNAYATCQVSSPSRASILTGRYTPRHGITDWIGEKSGEEWRSMNRHTKLLPAAYSMSLPTEELTLPEYLKQHGYVTFIAGKWHLGDEGSAPEDHGFDINKGGWAAGQPKGGYFSPYKNPKLSDGAPGENLSMRLSQETVRFIRQHCASNKKEPFFVYLSFYAVHGPIQTTREYWSYFRNKAQQMGAPLKGFEVDRTLPVRLYQDNPVYAGLIKQLDDAVGNLLEALEAMGVDENTMIIFTSDNGGVVSGDSYSTSLTPLRGGKGRQWEGGIREPLVIRYPGCKEGSVCDVPVIGTDFYPTILDFASLPLVPAQHVDGVSLMPLLRGDSIEKRSLFWHYPHYGNQGGEPSSAIRKGDWKLIHYYEDGRDELYNLSVDVSETEPLNHMNPEKVDELHTELMHWLKDVGAKSPVPDMQYDPKLEHQVKMKWRTKVLEQQEKQRLKMLEESWSPNVDWWGSLVIED